jgi:hypothetical protein
MLSRWRSRRSRGLACRRGRSFLHRCARLLNNFAGGCSRANIGYPYRDLFTRFRTPNENDETFDPCNTLSALAAIDYPDFVLFSRFDRLSARLCSLLRLFISPTPSRLITFGALIPIEATALTSPISITQNFSNTLRRPLILHLSLISVWVRKQFSGEVLRINIRPTS